jgi:hypothetical protein
MAGDGLSRPAAASPASGSGGTPGSHAYVAQSPRVLARMPDMGPETSVNPSEEPVPTGNEGRLVGARLSVNMLLGGVLALMLVALTLSFFLKSSPPTHTESPASSAMEAPRWNGSNSQVSNWPAPVSRDAAHASDTSPPENQSSAANYGASSDATASQSAAPWNSPGAQPISPTPVPATRGNSPWGSPTARTPTADATGAWGSGNRGGPWSNPSGVAGTATERAASTWGDPSQTITAVPQPAPQTDPNRPVGPMMPTAPLVHNGIYEAASPAPAYQNNSFGPSAYTADARGRAVPTPSGSPAATGPSSFPNGDAAGAGATPPNAVANPYSNPASNSFTPGSNQPSGYPSSGYPSNANPSNAGPSSGYPSAGYPSNANPSNAGPSSGYPSASYPPNANPSNAGPSSGYPSAGYPPNANPSNAAPSNGYPSAGYPSNANPSNGYPSTGYPSNASPSTGYPSTGYPSAGYPSSSYPSNGTNALYPAASGPAAVPTANGAAGYNGGAADPARARFDGGIERPTTPGGYDNARSSLY